jgi:large subunit ribosomal protein L15
MLQLSNLTSLVKKRKRIGRGGSRGGTSGRGHKGQKARSGHSRVRVGFEGGQTTLIRRLPKRGFNNKEFGTVFVIKNLSDLEKTFEAGSQITKNSFFEQGLIKGPRNVAIKILGNGTLTKKFVVHADAFSKNAIEEIKRCGGEVHITKES